ncbi:hypothetical protein HYU19_01970 [Candidatus Woesearchaeota archaeon]|nr:hypothetical protein [Candidatus Woesearchaeota archaeon]
MALEKKGQQDIVIGGISLILLIAFGSLQSHNAITENRYVLDTSTNKVYDLSRCSIKELNQSTVLSLEDYDDVVKKGYGLAECSR